MKKLLLFLLTVLAVSLQSYAETGTVAIVGKGYAYKGTITNKITSDQTEVKASGICTMKLNNGAFNTDDNGWRIYAKSTFTITPQTGVTLKKITWKDTKNKKDVTITAKPADAGKFSTTNHVSTWTGSSDKAITFSVIDQIRFNYIEITYETAGALKQTANLSWNAAEAKVTLGDNNSYVFSTLTVEPEAAKSLVHFSSSAPEVAEINAITGDITVKAVGTTTITATIDEDDTYYSASDSYKLTVREAPNNMSYTIIFKSNDKTLDASGSASATTDALIEEGANYISETETITLSKVYLGKKDFGLKFSSSEKSGSITLPLSELGQIYAHTIEVQAAQWGSDESSLKINGSAAQTIKGNDLATYTYTVSSDAPLTELKLEANKRLYVKQITVYRVPPMPAIDGMTDAGQNVAITPGETVLTVNVEKGCNLYVHEYFGESANAPQRVSSAVKDIDLTSGAWRLLNPDGSASVEYPVPAGVKEIHFVAEHKNHVSTPLSLMINEDGTATGIEDIEAAEAEGDTEWYTLQGVRVSAPAAAGLYIRRTAGTVEKVLVK